jgi:quercetin dioxygenase-like cupin family protein
MFDVKYKQFVSGVLVGAGIAALAVSGVAVGARGVEMAQGKPAGGSTSRILLENARVRVKEVTFPPGSPDKTMHTHDLAHVGIILTPGTLVFTEAGKPAETVKFDAGSVGYRDANVTHLATNPGKEPMRVIEVELK